jgi:hypothetical protein
VAAAFVGDRDTPRAATTAGRCRLTARAAVETAAPTLTTLGALVARRRQLGAAGSHLPDAARAARSRPRRARSPGG